MLSDLRIQFSKYPQDFWIMISFVKIQGSESQNLSIKSLVEPWHESLTIFSSLTFEKDPAGLRIRTWSQSKTKALCFHKWIFADNCECVCVFYDECVCSTRKTSGTAPFRSNCSIATSLAAILNCSTRSFLRLCSFIGGLVEFSEWGEGGADGVELSVRLFDYKTFMLPPY